MLEGTNQQTSAETKSEDTGVSTGTPTTDGVILEPETLPVVLPTPQYLTKEEAANLIAEAVQQAKDTGRREMQSEKDKEVAASIRRQRQLEAELSTLTASFKNLDPEAQKELELEQYRGRERTNKQFEAEEAQRRAVEETVNQFYVNLSEYAKDVGIDPTHKSLDWGQNNESLTIRQSKFLKSVAKVQKEQTKAKEDSISMRLKDETAKMRKELGLESVDSTTSGSASTDTIPTDRRLLGAYVENLTDAQYDKVYPKIKKMLDEGKIK